MGSTVLKENGEAFTTEELTAMKAAIHQHTFNHASRSSALVLCVDFLSWLLVSLECTVYSVS